jgi:hypothetical protein
MVASEWPTGYAMAVWRCHDHVGAAVEAAVRVNHDAVITVTPLATLDHPIEPTPEPDPSAKRSLRLVH